MNKGEIVSLIQCECNAPIIILPSLETVTCPNCKKEIDLTIKSNKETDKEDIKEKLENTRAVLDRLIETCRNEINISMKIIEQAEIAEDLETKNKELNEQMFWYGKLEVAEYIRYIYLD